MFVLSTAKVIVCLGIFGRLVSLQINEATKYKTLSDKNRFREWKLAPPRGLIKDFFKEMLDDDNFRPNPNKTDKSFFEKVRDMFA